MPEDTVFKDLENVQHKTKDYKKCQRILVNSKRIVIKIGSSLILKGEDGKKKINAERLSAFVKDIRKYKEQGKQIVLVSSGAVGLGKSILGLKGDIKLEEKQAAAAVGNPLLMSFYGQMFAEHFGDLRPTKVGQVLMTPLNTKEPRRRHNIRKTILNMLDKGIIPIINENDTVTTYSIRYGDNDSLASLVAKTISADTVILFTDILGYYKNFGKADASFLNVIEKVLPQHFEGAGGAGSAVGTGGMYTKIKAAKIATEEAGCNLVIACGRDLETMKYGHKDDEEHSFHNIRKLFAGEMPSTLFLSSSNPTEARNMRILTEGRCSHGGIVVSRYSDGDVEPKHVIRIMDEADRGEVVKIYTYIEMDLQLIGFGILAHSLTDVDRIKGLVNETDVSKALGYQGRYAIVKSVDMVLRRFRGQAISNEINTEK